MGQRHETENKVLITEGILCLPTLSDEQVACMYCGQ